MFFRIIKNLVSLTRPLMSNLSNLLQDRENKKVSPSAIEQVTYQCNNLPKVMFVSQQIAGILCAIRNYCGGGGVGFFRIICVPSVRMHFLYT